jgi:hypothetical protein
MGGVVIEFDAPVRADKNGTTQICQMPAKRTIRFEGEGHAFLQRQIAPGRGQAPDRAVRRCFG